MNSERAVARMIIRQIGWAASQPNVYVSEYDLFTLCSRFLHGYNAHTHSQTHMFTLISRPQSISASAKAKAHKKKKQNISALLIENASAVGRLVAKSSFLLAGAAAATQGRVRRSHNPTRNKKKMRRHTNTLKPSTSKMWILCSPLGSYARFSRTWLANAHR